MDSKNMDMPHLSELSCKMCSRGAIDQRLTPLFSRLSLGAAKRILLLIVILATFGTQASADAALPGGDVKDPVNWPPRAAAPGAQNDGQGRPIDPPINHQPTGPHGSNRTNTPVLKPNNNDSTEDGSGSLEEREDENDYLLITKHNDKDTTKSVFTTELPDDSTVVISDLTTASTIEAVDPDGSGDGEDIDDGLIIVSTTRKTIKSTPSSVNTRSSTLSFTSVDSSPSIKITSVPNVTQHTKSDKTIPTTTSMPERTPQTAATTMKTPSNNEPTTSAPNLPTETSSAPTSTVISTVVNVEISTPDDIEEGYNRVSTRQTTPSSEMLSSTQGPTAVATSTILPITAPTDHTDGDNELGSGDDENSSGEMFTTLVFSTPSKPPRPSKPPTPSKPPMPSKPSTPSMHQPSKSTMESTTHAFITTQSGSINTDTISTSSMLMKDATTIAMNSEGDGSGTVDDIITQGLSNPAFTTKYTARTVASFETTVQPGDDRTSMYYPTNEDGSGEELITTDDPLVTDVIDVETGSGEENTFSTIFPLTDEYEESTTIEYNEFTREYHTSIGPDYTTFVMNDKTTEKDGSGDETTTEGSGDMIELTTVKSFTTIDDDTESIESTAAFSTQVATAIPTTSVTESSGDGEYTTGELVISTTHELSGEVDYTTKPVTDDSEYTTASVKRTTFEDVSGEIDITTISNEQHTTVFMTMESSGDEGSGENDFITDGVFTTVEENYTSEFTTKVTPSTTEIVSSTIEPQLTTPLIRTTTEELSGEGSGDIEYTTFSKEHFTTKEDLTDTDSTTSSITIEFGGSGEEEYTTKSMDYSTTEDMSGEIDSTPMFTTNESEDGSGNIDFTTTQIDYAITSMYTTKSLEMTTESVDTTELITTEAVPLTSFAFTDVPEDNTTDMTTADTMETSESSIESSPVYEQSTESHTTVKEDFSTVDNQSTATVEEKTSETTSYTSFPIKTTSLPKEVPIFVEGEFKIEDSEYRSELAEKSSKEYKELASQLTDELNQIVAMSPYGNQFRGVKEMSFKKGSIIVNYVLEFGADVELDIKELENTFDEQTNQGKQIGERTLDPDFGFIKVVMPDEITSTNKPTSQVPTESTTKIQPARTTERRATEELEGTTETVTTAPGKLQTTDFLTTEETSPVTTTSIYITTPTERSIHQSTGLITETINITTVVMDQTQTTLLPEATTENVDSITTGIPMITRLSTPNIFETSQSTVQMESTSQDREINEMTTKKLPDETSPSLMSSSTTETSTPIENPTTSDIEQTTRDIQVDSQTTAAVEHKTKDIHVDSQTTAAAEQTTRDFHVDSQTTAADKQTTRDIHVDSQTTAAVEQTTRDFHVDSQTTAADEQTTRDIHVDSQTTAAVEQTTRDIHVDSQTTAALETTAQVLHSTTITKDEDTTITIPAETTPLSKTQSTEQSTTIIDGLKQTTQQDLNVTTEEIPSAISTTDSVTTTLHQTKVSTMSTTEEPFDMTTFEKDETTLNKSVTVPIDGETGASSQESENMLPDWALGVLVALAVLSTILIIAVIVLCCVIKRKELRYYDVPPSASSFANEEKDANIFMEKPEILPYTNPYGSYSTLDVEKYPFPATTQIISNFNSSGSLKEKRVGINRPILVPQSKDPASSQTSRTSSTSKKSGGSKASDSTLLVRAVNGNGSVAQSFMDGVEADGEVGEVVRMNELYVEDEIPSNGYSNRAYSGGRQDDMSDDLLQNFQLAWTNLNEETNIRSIRYPGLPNITTYYDQILDSYNTKL